MGEANFAAAAEILDWGIGAVISDPCISGGSLFQGPSSQSYIIIIVDDFVGDRALFILVILSYCCCYCIITFGTVCWVVVGATTVSGTGCGQITFYLGGGY